MGHLARITPSSDVILIVQTALNEILSLGGAQVFLTLIPNRELIDYATRSSYRSELHHLELT